MPHDGASPIVPAHRDRPNTGTQQAAGAEADAGAEVWLESTPRLKVTVPSVAARSGWPGNRRRPGRGRVRPGRAGAVGAAPDGLEVPGRDRVASARCRARVSGEHNGERGDGSEQHRQSSRECGPAARPR
jgi:hypothetical protein